MRVPSKTILALAMAGAALSHPLVVRAQQAAVSNPAHTHLGHVADRFRDTPEGKGLLPTAAGEAAVVVTHAGLMANASDNLDVMKRHAGHVLHAIDPTAVTEGPGLGYGLRKAAEASAAHITMAGSAEVASQNVKTHAQHVARAARNTVTRAERIQELAQEIRDATDAAAAAELAAELKTLADQLVAGSDANQDGRVGWQESEGGLAVAETHVGLMKQGEGLGGS